MCPTSSVIRFSFVSLARNGLLAEGPPPSLLLLVRGGRGFGTGALFFSEAAGTGGASALMDCRISLWLVLAGSVPCRSRSERERGRARVLRGSPSFRSGRDLLRRTPCGPLPGVTGLLLKTLHRRMVPV